MEVNFLLVALAGLLGILCLYFRSKYITGRNSDNTRERQFLDKIPFCIDMWDKDYNLVFCNQLTLETYGFSDFSQYAHSYTTLMPRFQPCGTRSEDKLRQMIDKAMVDGVAHFEMITFTVSGLMLDVEVFMRRIRLGTENMVVGYMHDLRHSKEILAAKEDAEERSQAKGRFLAHMSHEIRTPMNVIVGLTEILLRNNSHDHDTTVALRRIQNAGNVLVSIINDILDISKVESGKMEVAADSVSIQKLIIDTMQFNRALIGDRKLEFLLEVDPDLPQHFMGDEIRLRQVLNNVLSNAFKYTASGSISMQFSQRPGRLKISIKDTGMGMTADELGRLFKDEFVRYNPEATRNIEGTGLGLSIVHQFVMLMNGTINVDSEPGMGTVFVIGLPLRPIGDATLGVDGVERILHASDVEFYEGQSVRPMPHGRILVVDDVEINIEIMQGILEPYQLQFDSALSGHEALQKIHAGQQYDIIFMDHMMPEMDGIEVAHAMRDLGYTRPIVALTAAATHDTYALFYEHGFQGFVPKPVELAKLNECLEMFIE